jgi:hypothetical protein
MDSFTTLYEKLRERARLAQDTVQKLPADPPTLEDWLRYWNDSDTDLTNLRNLDHWMSRTRKARNN